MAAWRRLHGKKLVLTNFLLVFGGLLTGDRAMLRGCDPDRRLVALRRRRRRHAHHLRGDAVRLALVGVTGGAHPQLGLHTDASVREPLPSARRAFSARSGFPPAGARALQQAPRDWRHGWR